MSGGSLGMKAAWQLLAAMFAAVLPLATSGGVITASDWINVVLVALGAGTVYIAENQPEGTVWHYTKAIMSAITAGGVVAVSALTDASITVAERYQIGAAIAGVILTYAVPNDTLLPRGRHQMREG